MLSRIKEVNKLIIYNIDNININLIKWAKKISIKKLLLFLLICLVNHFFIIKHYLLKMKIHIEANHFVEENKKSHSILFNYSQNSIELFFIQ